MNACFWFQGFLVDLFGSDKITIVGKVSQDKLGEMIVIGSDFDLRDPNLDDAKRMIRKIGTPWLEVMRKHRIVAPYNPIKVYGDFLSREKLAREFWESYQDVMVVEILREHTREHGQIARP